MKSKQTEAMQNLGQRVPRETVEAFNKVAREDYKTTPARALRCLMNAFANRNGKGIETLLKVQISAGVTRAEVRQEVARQNAELEKRIIDAMTALVGKSSTNQAIVYQEQGEAPTEEEEKFAASFDELWKQSKLKDGVLYILGNLTEDDKGAVMSEAISDMKLNRQWQKNPDQSKQGYWTVSIPNDSITSDIASDFGKRFKSKWIASRLKK